MYVRLEMLVLSPSRGLGGGVERYVAALTDALTRGGTSWRRIDLHTRPEDVGRRAKLRFAASAVREMATARNPLRVVVAHRDLVPILRVCRRWPRYAGAVIIIHGSEVWSSRRARGRAVLRRPDSRVVAASTYTAGALIAADVQSTVLWPGLERSWFDTLSASRPGTHDGVELMTAFRLIDWRDKGLETIIEAMRLTSQSDLHLTVCGSGTPPRDLVSIIDAEPRVTLRANLCDRKFADRLASADIFVLATRTRAGHDATGEGFGLVLSEAQVAATPVIAPAFGGGDAFQQGLTGLAPVDESARALATRIRCLVNDPVRRADMGKEAARWARSQFDPDVYAARVAEVLLSEND